MLFPRERRSYEATANRYMLLQHQKELEDLFASLASQLELLRSRTTGASPWLSLLYV